MALGVLNIIDKIAGQGPVMHLKVTIVGDGAYASGGSQGLLAKLRAALQLPGLKILDARDAYAAVATQANHVVYDAVNDRLISRVTSTGAEFTTANQSGTTYTLFVVAY